MDHGLAHFAFEGGVGDGDEVFEVAAMGDECRPIDPAVKGNEKGDVENACKRSERTYLSPVPQVESLSQLASKLFDDCQNDLRRRGTEVHGGKTVGELLVEERPHFLPLQSERFAACRRRSTFVDGLLKNGVTDKLVCAWDVVDEVILPGDTSHMACG